MAKVDLHVHSRFSEHPSTWFLQRLGTRESYVDPEEVFRRAVKCGMDFVTLTDHNCIEGALALSARYPGQVFTGVESTTYFPEDGAKVHILVWGLNEVQFRDIERVRESIYDLRDYLVQQDLAHAVAHATFSLNRILTIEHIERLFVLFDCFEAINGSRNRASNEAILRALSSLTASRIAALAAKHGLRPRGSNSWRKGMVGGSDDHSGLFIGRTYTVANASSIEELLEEIKGKHMIPAGRHNDYQGLAVAIYKVAYDFSKTRSRALTSSLFSALNALIFEQDTMGLRNRMVLEKMRLSKSSRDGEVKRIALDLVEALRATGDTDIERRVAMLEAKVSAISDAFFKSLIDKIAQAVRDGDIINCIKSISASLPGIFLSIPFFTTLRILNESRPLSEELIRTFVLHQNTGHKRVLWFTDTLTDLNGVSATLTKLANLADERGLDLCLVACLTDQDRMTALPANVVELPCLATHTSSFFNTYTLRIPSVLSSLKKVYEMDPDEIYISTPGPVGLLGLLLARLLKVPCTGIYHTDFTRQAKQIIEDDYICKFIEDGSIWFYSCMDTIWVPTNEYIDILARRGFDRGKMVRFKRGIDHQLFSPRFLGEEYLEKEYGIAPGITFVHSGRVSKEKNVDFLAVAYRRLAETYENTNLVFAGDGPYLDEFSEKMSDCPRVHFIGRVARERLPLIYSASSAMIFPSVTDTFGMVILEAQACGLPVVVSDFGGPKEIVIDGRTGFVAKADNLDEWVGRMEHLVHMIVRFPDLYEEMRQNARRHIVSTYNWDFVLDDIFGTHQGHSATGAAWEARAGRGVLAPQSLA